MPREQINYPSPSIPRDPDAPEDCDEMWTDAALHVHWGSGFDENITSSVQIAFEADPVYLRFAAEHAGDNETARPVLFSPTLERSEINKLIRTLRRARDQAYGRDE